MLPSIIVCCYNLIFYVMIQSTTNHYNPSVEIQVEKLLQEKKTNHHMGISHKILSENTYNLSMNNLHNNKIPASRSHNFYIEPVPKGYIPEYWAEIFLFISTTSLPISSKFLKNYIVQPEILAKM